MNPINLWRKGSFPLWIAARELLRPMLKDPATAWVGKQSAWRPDRLQGNMLASMDVLRDRITAERIVTLIRNED
jgi:hypothetical protein